MVLRSLQRDHSGAKVLYDEPVGNLLEMALTVPTTGESVFTNTDD